MAIDISETIEEIVKKKRISYMDAILEYTDEIDGEIEGVAKLLNKSIDFELLTLGNNPVTRLFAVACTSGF